MNNNNIPKGWRKVKLGEVAKVKNGKSNSVDAVVNGKYIFFDRSQNIKRSNKYLFDCEAIIVPGEGENFIPRYFQGKFDLHQRVYAIYDFSKEINSKFLFYYLLSNHKYFSQVAVGSTVKSLRIKHFTEFIVNLPPLDEQKRIAEILSAFDDKIELNNKIIKTLEEIAQVIFKEWFVKFRFPGWEKLKFVDSELGKIPEGWKIGKLGDIMCLRKERFKKYEEWKSLRLLDLGRFPQKSLAITSYGKGEEIKTSAIKFYRKDILFGAVRPYFHKVVLAPFNGVTNQSVFVIFPKHGKFFSPLVTILFSESTIKYATAKASGTKMPVIKYEDLAEMQIIIPDELMLQLFNNLIDNFYNIIIEKTEENQKLSALRDLLLPKLMSPPREIKT
jgi:type I restriction enzyme S subunit